MNCVAKLLLCGAITTNVMFAADLEIDKLLNIISSKDDLSEKTKLENGGISYIYTRDDIRRMQAHNLRDILKSTYPFGYNENKFGLADPYMMQTSAPFMSSNIRIYIDDQEIISGLYGSGIIIYGDMDIDFVDHIEVYSGNPTFEFSTEPAFTIVKLYSKVAQKDSGSKVALNVGSYNNSYLYGYHTQELSNDWSYFSYISKHNDNRKEYTNKDATLSRDKDNVHLFGSLYNNNNKILIDLIGQKRDSFIANSEFATPDISTLDGSYVHIGYNGNNDNLSYKITYNNHNATSDFVDKYKNEIQNINNQNNTYHMYSIYSKFDSKTYTAGLQYNKKSNQNSTLIGATYRIKDYVFKDVIINDNLVVTSSRSIQRLLTTFLENQYNINTNKIITTGGAYTTIKNSKFSYQDDNLLSYRLGYTYTNQKWVSKTILSHIESSLDPYLINSRTFMANPTIRTDITKYNLIMQNLKYTQDNNTYEAIVSYEIIKNQLVQNNQAKLYSYDKDLIMRSLAGRYLNEYNELDKVEITLGINHIKHLPTVETLKQYSMTLKTFNHYGKFDIFNELLYYTDDNVNSNFYDYSCGVIYNKTDDLKIALKGTNLLNKAKETSYTQKSIQTLQNEEPLSISPIDRSITISMEYTF